VYPQHNKENENMQNTMRKQEWTFGQRAAVDMTPNSLKEEEDHEYNER
jgi:hypothetical protein